MDIQLTPADELNQELLAHAHPHDWRNPTPTGRYNLVAVGGGTAGIIAALGTAGLGGRAALIERHLLGGDCLNYGCVPSKALLRVRGPYTRPHWANSTVSRSTAPRGSISPPSCNGCGGCEPRSAITIRPSGLRSWAWTCSSARPRSAGPDTIEVAGQTLRFKRAVIATGSRAATPAIDGLAEVGYLTNETVFSLTSLPRRLAVIGAGPIGCELAQAFRCFGSEVHLIGRGGSILKKEDPAAAQIVQSQLEREGVHLYLGWTTLRADRTGDSKSLLVERGGQKQKLIADEILVAAGRRPNVEGLALEAAGVRYSERGVDVDDYLRTSNRAIYAAGDVCMKQQFTHAADAMARLCIQNALFLGRKRFSRAGDPPLHVHRPGTGARRSHARRGGGAGHRDRQLPRGIGRGGPGVLDGEERGFAVVHTRRGTGRVVGATIVAAHAGEMIGEITILMTRGLRLSALASVIHCYPTQVEALRRIADAYSRTRLTPRVAALLKRWLEWRR